MHKQWRLVKMAFRAALWRTTPDPQPASFANLLGCIIVALCAEGVMQYLEAVTPARFNPYGLNATIAWCAVGLVVTGLFVWPGGRLTFLAGSVLLAVFVNLLRIANALVLPSEFWTTHKIGLWTNSDTAVLFFLLQLVWGFGASFTILRSIDATGRRKRFNRVVALYATTLLLSFLVPYDPVFKGRDFDRRLANYWEYIPALLRGDFVEEPAPRRVDRARVELAQPALMDEAIARLAPQTRGETDVYAIGIAGWAEQDVFIKELDGALAAVGKVLPVRDRTLRLVNHVDTVEKTPAALRANFAAAVRAVARKMDRDEDVLLLFMTSHGSPDGVALQLPGLLSVDLAPEDVAAVLDREGIKNRIVAVSACYSGVFVKPLANDNTIVITAADEKSTSFGCSNEREWTYFGDAFFNHNLRADVSIEEAFLDAKVTIGQWEAADGLTPSNPQGHFGPALMAKLARVYGTSRQATQTNAR
jgi:Peptidase C13 family